MDEVFRKIFDEEEWIKSVDFKISSQDNNDSFNENLITSFHTKNNFFKISRYGLFQCRDFFSFMFKSVIEEMASNASNNFSLYDNRNRSKNDDYRLKPVCIEFDSDIFKDKKENKSLADVLNKISDSSLSIFHSNPYFHASYVDYRDGSSYDIWVLSNNKITIIPQMKSTAAAIDRLIEMYFHRI